MITQKRNYGIDLLRIISMFYVLVVHTIAQGGASNAVQSGTQYKVIWFIEIWVFCVVDVFAIISGWVGYSEKEKKVKYSNYISLWFQVVFYGLLVTLLFYFARPGTVRLRDFVKACFPVKNNLYWYFTAYTGLFVLMPLLNKAVRACSISFARKILLLIFIAFPIFSLSHDKFELIDGYSVLWLVILYLIGAIMKKCDVGKNISMFKAIVGIITLVVITWAIKMYPYKIVPHTNITIDNNLLINYVSPTILLIAMLYIVVASKMKFNKHIESCIKFCAPNAFAAYLLNNQFFVWNYVMKERFAFLANTRSVLIPLIVVGFSATFFIASILIDKVRCQIFKLLHIDHLAVSIEKMCRKVVGKIIK